MARFGYCKRKRDYEICFLEKQGAAAGMTFTPKSRSRISNSNASATVHDIVDELWQLIFSYCHGTTLTVGAKHQARCCSSHSFSQISTFFHSFAFVSKSFLRQSITFIQNTPLTLDSYIPSDIPILSFMCDYSRLVSQEASYPHALKLGHFDLRGVDFNGIPLPLHRFNALDMCIILHLLRSCDLSSLKHIYLPRFHFKLEDTYLKSAVRMRVPDHLIQQALRLTENESQSILVSTISGAHSHTSMEKENIDGNSKKLSAISSISGVTSLESLGIPCFEHVHLPLLQRFSSSLMTLSLDIDTKMNGVLHNVHDVIKKLTSLKNLRLAYSEPHCQHALGKIQITSASLEELYLCSPSELQGANFHPALKRLSVVTPLDRFDSGKILSSCLSTLEYLKLTLLWSNLTNEQDEAILSRLSEAIQKMPHLKEFDLHVESNSQVPMKMRIESSSLLKIRVGDGGLDQFLVAECICPSLQSFVCGFDLDRWQLSGIIPVMPFRRTDWCPRWNEFVVREKAFVGMSVPDSCIVKCFIPR